MILPAWKNPRYGRTSRLYLSEFFFDVVKPLEPIAELLKKEGFQSVICDGSTNEGSILPLKLAAVRAGLGWQGKHSLLVSKKNGTFLAEMNLLNIEGRYPEMWGPLPSSEEVDMLLKETGEMLKWLKNPL